MTDIAILKAAGLTAEQIVRILELEQKERQAARREQNRINKQNQRARQHVSADRADIADITLPPSLPLKKGLPQTPSKEITPSDPPSPVGKGARAKPKTALPTDFALSESDKQHAFSRGWTPDKVSIELARFRDHAEAHGSRYANWHAAWRNWVTSPFQDQKLNGNSNGRMDKTNGSRRGSALDALDELFGSGADVDGGAESGYRTIDLSLPKG